MLPIPSVSPKDFDFLCPGCGVGALFVGVGDDVPAELRVFQGLSELAQHRAVRQRVILRAQRWPSEGADSGDEPVPSPEPKDRAGAALFVRLLWIQVRGGRQSLGESGFSCRGKWG